MGKIWGRWVLAVGLVVPTYEQLEHCRALYELLSTKGGARIEGTLNEGLVPSGPFLDYLNSHRQTWAAMTQSEKQSAFSEFFLAEVPKLLDPERLQLAENRALAEGLQAHGVGGDLEHPRKRLEVISAQNRARLRGKGYVSSPAMKEAEGAVGDLRLQFRHNTLSRGPAEGTALVSSRQLENMGLGGGANSTEFGRDFMRGDDQVYFWTDLRPKDVALGEGVHEHYYGSRAVFANPEYAARHGWMSVYVMYPSNLRRFGKGYFSDVVLKMDTRSEPDIDEKKLFAVHRADLETIRNGLHQMDFTVSDFEAAVKEQMLQELDRLRVSKPDRFREMLEKLRSSDVRKQRDAWDALVAFPWKLDTTFELKIPVAVPATQLEFQ